MNTAQIRKLSKVLDKTVQWSRFRTREELQAAIEASLKEALPKTTVKVEYDWEPEQNSPDYNMLIGLSTPRCLFFGYIDIYYLPQRVASEGFLVTEYAVNND